MHLFSIEESHHKPSHVLFSVIGQKENSGYSQGRSSSNPIPPNFPAEHHPSSQQVIFPTKRPICIGVKLKRDLTHKTTFDFYMFIAQVGDCVIYQKKLNSTDIIIYSMPGLNI